MATGSPISTLFKNLMPLVVRPSRTSRQGMILLLSIRAVPGQKILQDGEAEPPAFLRVELGGHQVAPPQGAGKLCPVLRHPQHHGGLSRVRVVAVDEVVLRGLGQPGKYRMRLEKTNRVPPHVGD